MNGERSNGLPWTGRNAEQMIREGRRALEAAWHALGQAEALREAARRCARCAWSGPPDVYGTHAGAVRACLACGRVERRA